MSPFEHREVFVLDDGGEVDLDLGNYERFLDIKLTQDNNITTGKIYQYVINKERRGDSLGKTVQVVPHITDAIEEWIEHVAMKPVNGMEGLADVCVIELGDTIGIRDHINSKSMCVCGSMKMLADDLLPNKTIRETISRILGSTTRSAFSRSSVHVQDMESACSPQPKVLLPTVSAATKEECATPLCENDTSIMQESRKEGKTDLNMLELSSKKSWATKNVSRSEVIIESVSVREATSQPTAPQAKEEVQQKLLVGEKGHLQWKTSEAFVAENFWSSSLQPISGRYADGSVWRYNALFNPYATLYGLYLGCILPSRSLRSWRIWVYYFGCSSESEEVF